MTIKASEIHPTDLLSHIAYLLEAAQLIGLYPKGEELSFDIVEFIRQLTKEVANEAA